MVCTLANTAVYNDLSGRKRSFQLSDTTQWPISREKKQYVSPTKHNYNDCQSYHIYCRVRVEVLFEVIRVNKLLLHKQMVLSRKLYKIHT